MRERRWVRKVVRGSRAGASKVCGGSEEGMRKWENGTGTWLEWVWRQQRGSEETRKREKRKAGECEGT